MRFTFQVILNLNSGLLNHQINCDMVLYFVFQLQCKAIQTNQETLNGYSRLGKLLCLVMD